MKEELRVATSALYVLCLACASLESLLDESAASAIRAVCGLAVSLGAAQLVAAVLNRGVF